MKFIVRDIKSRRFFETIALAYFAKEKPVTHPLWRYLKAGDKKQISRLFDTHEFTGKDNEAKVILRQPGGKIFLLGLGDKKKWNLRKLVLASRRIIMQAKTEKIKQILVSLEQLSATGCSTEKLGQIFTENAIMANYEFLHYKENTKESFDVKEFGLAVNRMAVKSVAAGVKAGQIIGEQTNLARDLGNIPGGEMTPTFLANKAKEVSRGLNIKVKILGSKEMKKLKMGAILGVAHGSVEKPRFIIMEYWGAAKKEMPYVFVGKGITFDTGGLNLKPGKSMSDMHLDMIGGAAVVAALGAIAQLKLPVNAVGLVPAVENMPSGESYRPGDLLKSLSGKTIEVLNTDAEGRIVLADALAYAAKYKPKLVVDLATLTGACMTALGLQLSGLMTPNKDLQNKLQTVGDISGDYVWPLPLWEEYEEEVKGTFGDVQNVGKSGYGDAIVGAMFLWQFAKKYLWAHLDIAGPMKTVEGQYLAKGASGVGVRFLVELARSY